MGNKALRLAGASLVLLLATGTLAGQSPTGLPPLGSFGGGPFDTVNNASLDIHFSIPVVSKSGRGIPFAYALTYDSLIWTHRVGGGWIPATGWGWQQTGAGITGLLGYVQKQYTADILQTPTTTGSTFSALTQTQAEQSTRSI